MSNDKKHQLGLVIYYFSWAVLGLGFSMRGYGGHIANETARKQVVKEGDNK